MLSNIELVNAFLTFSVCSAIFAKCIECVGSPSRRVGGSHGGHHPGGPAARDAQNTTRVLLLQVIYLITRV